MVYIFGVKEEIGNKLHVASYRKPLTLSSYVKLCILGTLFTHLATVEEAPCDENRMTTRSNSLYNQQSKLLFFSTRLLIILYCKILHTKLADKINGKARH